MVTYRSHTPKFAKGDTVRLRSLTAEMGVILAEPRCFNQKFSYSVNMAGRIRNYAENDLELCRLSEDPKELFLDGSFGDRESCLTFLTYLRVAGSLSNYIYSFYSSRTEFFVHQFKPLLKFVDSGAGRILIADEVGLGKTIESGFILLEMIARKELQRALIVCPAKLRNKWRRELLSKFDIDFRVFNSASLIAQLRDIDRNPAAPLLGIVSYETVRTERVRQEVSNLKIDLDVFIADEAHRMRNSNSQQFAAGQTLAGVSSKVLLLTATPINNRSEDLFNLLQLLNPSLFANLDFFETIHRVNTRIVTLERMIRRGLPLNVQDILGAIESIEHSELRELFKDNYFLKRLKTMVEEGQVTSLDTHVEAQRLTARVNLLSGHVCRTRRVDIDEKRPERNPHLCRVEPDPREETLYKEVYDLMLRHYQGFRLPVMNMERILSSCIPAFIRSYGDVASGEAEPDTWDDEDSGSGEREGIQSERSTRFPGLARILKEHGNPILEAGIDTKLTSLIEVLRNLDSSDPNSKILIFSYYRRTIAYLVDQLSRRGYGVLSIHGGVPTCPEDPSRDEREIRQERFRGDPSIRILISSEVGSEGLDFQFSHVVINYDLPWNPMRVEQRIGRVDRIGQRADRILVYSLVLAGMIDDLIYEYLLKKIGIFEECLGDIESILGTEVRDIQDAVFSIEMSEDEKRRRVERAGEVLLRKLLEAQRLERESSKLLGTDQYIKDEIQRILHSRRFVGPREIRCLVHRAFSWPQLSLNIERSNGSIYFTELTRRAKRFFEQYMDTSRSASLFKASLRKETLRWTYDYDVAMTDPGLELFNLRHPAVRAICKYLEQNSGHLTPTFRVQLAMDPSDRRVNSGLYVLAVFTVEYTGFHQRAELFTLAWNYSLGEYLDDTEAGALLNAVITKSEDTDELYSLPQHVGKEVINELENRAEAVFEQKRSEIAGEENAFLSQRRVQVADQAKREITSEEQRRVGLRQVLRHHRIRGEKREAQRIEALLKGVGTRINNIQTRMEARLEELPEKSEVTYSWRIESLGIVMLVR